jgi:hypothetical protein
MTLWLAGHRFQLADAVFPRLRPGTLWDSVAIFTAIAEF